MIDEKEIAAAGFKPWGAHAVPSRTWYGSLQGWANRIWLNRFWYKQLRASFDGVDGEPADDFRGAMSALAPALRTEAAKLRRRADAMEAAAARAAALAEVPE